jgi:intracellular septation protein
MQALLDFLPLAAFLVAYRVGGIYVATAVLMISMVALLAVDWLLKRRLPAMHLISAVLVLLLGTATLVLRDARFLQWKPTIFLWLVAVAAAGSGWIGNAPLAQRLLAPMLGTGAQPSRRVWLRLNWLWVAFYALLGGVNLWVARTASERAWVNFKVFGLTAAFLLFAVGQAAWLSARTQPATSGTSA